MTRLVRPAIAMAWLGAVACSSSEGGAPAASARASASASSRSASPAGGASGGVPSSWRQARFDPPAPEARRARAIAGGRATNCAVLEDGSVWCWGSDQGGELGWDMPLDPKLPFRVVPTHVEGVRGATAVASTNGQVCALVAEGEVMCWGALPATRPTPRERILARRVEGVRGAVALVLDSVAACAVRDDGHVLCWRGVAGAWSPAVEAKGIVTKELRVGYVQPGLPVACLRAEDGAVRCGRYDDGAAANGEPFQGLVALPALTGRAIEVSHDRGVCALTARGALCQTGKDFAELAAATPRPLEGGEDAVAISGPCLLGKDGHVRAPATSQVAAVDLPDVVSASCAWGGCALDRAGAVWCWGSNYGGQNATGDQLASAPAPIKW